MSLETKRAELESVKARGQAIIEQYAAGGIPAEKKAELANLKTRGYELAGEIKTEREIEESKKDFLPSCANATQKTRLGVRVPSVRRGACRRSLRGAAGPGERTRVRSALDSGTV